MSTILERRRAQIGRAKVLAEQQEETCELCYKPLGEESELRSDGVNEPVRICLECADRD